MKATSKNRLITLVGLILSLLFALPSTVLAKDKSRHPNVAAVTGQSDWSIVPVVIPSDYVTFYDDGSATIARMPLAGNFALTGDGAAINGVVKGILSADLDPTLSGPIYGPLLITQESHGKEKVIFTGSFFGRVNGLLASGQIILRGRGEFTGQTIAVSFLETDANTEVFVLTGHLLDRRGD